MIDAAALRGWFAERAPLRADDEAADWGVALIEEAGADEAEVVRAARDWQRQLHAAGLTELDAVGERVFREVAACYRTPDLRPLLIGLCILGPALRVHGTAALRMKYLEPILRGEHLACQLFSEPDAGSDLAGVRARADRVEDGWLVNGQKVWTSNAHFADVAELLVRTDPGSARHAGLSMLVLEMGQPGIEVRPIRQMTGGAAFNEVFLTDVFVPEGNLIGAEGAGWQVAMTSLNGERSALGGEFEAVPPHLVERLGSMVRERGLADDARAQEALVEAALAAFAHESVVRYGGHDPQHAAAAASVSKILVGRLLEQMTDAVLEVAGGDALLERGSGPDSDWSEFILGKPAVSIAGGSDEIQKNLIAERHLMLPKER